MSLREWIPAFARMTAGGEDDGWARRHDGSRHRRGGSGHWHVIPSHDWESMAPAFARQTGLQQQAVR